MVFQSTNLKVKKSNVDRLQRMSLPVNPARLDDRLIEENSKESRKRSRKNENKSQIHPYESHSNFQQNFNNSNHSISINSLKLNNDLGNQSSIDIDQLYNEPVALNSSQDIHIPPLNTRKNYTEARAKNFAQNAHVNIYSSKNIPTLKNIKQRQQKEKFHSFSKSPSKSKSPLSKLENEEIRISF